MNRKDLKIIMTKYEGQLQVKGYSWDIVAKHLAAGVYRVTLKRGERTSIAVEEDSALPTFERDALMLSEALRG